MILSYAWIFYIHFYLFYCYLEQEARGHFFSLRWILCGYCWNGRSLQVWHKKKQDLLTRKVNWGTLLNKTSIFISIHHREIVMYSVKVFLPQTMFYRFSGYNRKANLFCLDSNPNWLFHLFLTDHFPLRLQLVHRISIRNRSFSYQALLG